MEARDTAQVHENLIPGARTSRFFAGFAVGKDISGRFSLVNILFFCYNMAKEKYPPHSETDPEDPVIRQGQNEVYFYERMD